MRPCIGGVDAVLLGVWGDCSGAWLRSSADVALPGTSGVCSPAPALARRLLGPHCCCCTRKQTHIKNGGVAYCTNTCYKAETSGKWWLN